MPVYHLETAHFLDGIWYPAGADIEWAGEPSRHMVPTAEWVKRRKERANRGGAPLNRGHVVSNPNANPPVIRGNTLPAKEAMAGPEAPAEAVGAPNDERNPDFVPPNQSRPIAPGAEEAAQVSSSRPEKAPEPGDPDPAPRAERHHRDKHEKPSK